jgi:hypothetical protein
MGKETKILSLFSGSLSISGLLPRKSTFSLHWLALDSSHLRGVIGVNWAVDMALQCESKDLKIC